MSKKMIQRYRRATQDKTRSDEQRTVSALRRRKLTKWDLALLVLKESVR